MTDKLLFANARAKAKEGNLFSEERLFRMAEQTDIKDAVKILNEAGYGGGVLGTDPADYQTILDAEEAGLYAFINEVKPEGAGFECFYIQRDYLNLKAMVKAVYTGIPAELFAKYGTRSKAEIEAIANGVGSAGVADASGEGGTPHNSYMTSAIAEIAKRVVKKGASPRVIDTVIDRAMFLEIASRCKTAGGVVAEYFMTYTDLTNISTCARTKAIGESFAFFEDAFMPGGSIEIGRFKDKFDNLTALLAGTKYAEFGSKISADMVDFDRERDNLLLRIFKKERFDMFSPAPILGYYLAKISELKTLRIVLTCIKNKVKRADIKARMRELYGA